MKTQSCTMRQYTNRTRVDYPLGLDNDALHVLEI